MKAKFELRKPVYEQGLKWYVWECVGGTTIYNRIVITPGCTISFVACLFWCGGVNSGR